MGNIIPKLKIKFPFVRNFRDYHEIDFFMDDLNKLFQERIRSYELGCDGMYWAVFYIGKRPKKSTTDIMLDNAGFDFDHVNNWR